MIDTQIRKKYSFADYMALTEQLVAEGRTTGPVQSEAMASYTKMNLQRMRRLNKTTVLTQELENSVQNIKSPHTFLVISEPWCGDAAQNVPILDKIASANPQIKLEIVLRDDNLDLMDQHLTNGGRSIPKLLVVNDLSGEIVAEWGPRPEPVQEMVMERKHMDPATVPPYSEFVEVVQKWYNKDKTQTAQRELAQVFAEIK